MTSKHLTDLKYMQSRLFNKYPRWRNSVVWMFWALNTFEMRKLQSEISILSRIKKQTSQLLTAGDIANPSSESLSNSYMFMKTIRGTAAYWKDQLLVLLAKINTLGPTWKQSCSLSARLDSFLKDVIMGQDKPLSMVLQCTCACMCPNLNQRD